MPRIVLAGEARTTPVSGVTGQTHKEIKEKFGFSFNDLVKAEDLMANFALAFAWFRETDHMPVPAAYGTMIRTGRAG